MGRGKRREGRPTPALSDSDGRRHLVPALSLPLRLQVPVHWLGGEISLADGEEPVLRLNSAGDRVLVLSPQQTMVGNLGQDPGQGELLATLMREGRTLEASVAEKSGGWGKPLKLILDITVDPA